MQPTLGAFRRARLAAQLRALDLPTDVPALAEAISYFAVTAHIAEAAEAIVEDNLREKISVGRVARQIVPLYESIWKAKGK